MTEKIVTTLIIGAIENTLGTSSIVLNKTPKAMIPTYNILFIVNRIFIFYNIKNSIVLILCSAL